MLRLRRTAPSDDIAQANADLEEGRRAMRLLHAFEQDGAGWFWETDRAGRLTYLSERVARVLAEDGIDTAAAALTEVFQLDHDSGATARTLGFHLTSRTGFSSYPVRAVHGDGERWWSITGRPIFDARGQFEGFAGSGTDLTEKRRSEAEITRLALFDGLTGLANRQRMRAALDEALAQARGGYRPLAMLLLDLDRFKAVNDTLGHQTGDELLKQVAQRLLRSVGEEGLVGRLGGDEFQVVLPDEVNRERLGALADTIISSLSHPYFISGSPISIGCSIGIALSPDNGEDAETLTRNADLALYAAKADGRGLHRFYRDELLKVAHTRRQMEGDLRTALAAGQFRVFYQPVVSTREERIVGYEALIRWQHPVRGFVSPAEFIPVAEEAGLIEAIGEWVLRTACAEAATWPGQVRVAVNVSPIQFANPALPAIVANALARSGIAPARLEIELTEGVFLDETASSDAMFKSLKALGVRLALDDFGTGYSSLGYLKSAPFDKIKIDQSFVRGAAIPGTRNAAIIKAIVTLADTLGMETTAEGVEIQDEITLIRELGCSHIQGYVYGKPGDGATVLKALVEGGGKAVAQGFKVSRSPRTKTIRRALLKLGGTEGEVRIRNLSSSGAMIDGIAFGREVKDVDVQIELLEDELFPATLRWAKDGRAGLQFAEPFDMTRLAPVKPGRRE